jgi:4-hydroxybenzoate polyprenyltransferase
MNNGPPMETPVVSPAFQLRDWWQTLRPHQWIKNVLVLAPAFAAHRIAMPGMASRSLLALLAMTLAAALVYVVNDVADRAADRAHPRKRERPIARGAISTGQALGLALLLGVALVATLYALPIAVSIWIGAYVALAFLYSYALKRQPIADVMVLAALYTLRILVGGAATGLPISPWLLSFSMFLFFGLALLKRFIELNDPKTDGDVVADARGYRPTDGVPVGMFGIASGFMGIVILALYITGSDVTALYRAPGWLWGLCALLSYWLCRVWLLAFRGDVHDDPVYFALTDRASLVTAVLMVGCVVAAT